MPRWSGLHVMVRRGTGDYGASATGPTDASHIPGTVSWFHTDGVNESSRFSFSYAVTTTNAFGTKSELPFFTMSTLSSLTVFCVFCNVRHVVNYRCAAVRSRNPVDRIHINSPNIATALSESLDSGATRQVRTVR